MGGLPPPPPLLLPSPPPPPPPPAVGPLVIIVVSCEEDLVLEMGAFMVTVEVLPWLVILSIGAGTMVSDSFDSFVS